MNKHFVNITCKLKLEPMESKLHCQKYSIGTETTKALLKSDLRWMTKIIYSHSNLLNLEKY